MQVLEWAFGKRLTPQERLRKVCVYIYPPTRDRWVNRYHKVSDLLTLLVILFFSFNFFFPFVASTVVRTYAT